MAARQGFVAECSVLLVWVADLGRANRLAARHDAEVAATGYLESTLIAFIDTALAAQNAVVAAEALGLGTTFVGAMRNRPDEVAAELGLPDHTVAAFGLAVGVPDPTEAADVKPRLPQSAVLHHEHYDAERADAGIPAYDDALAAYNARFDPGAGPRVCSHGSRDRSRWPGATCCARCGGSGRRCEDERLGFDTLASLAAQPAARLGSVRSIVGGDNEGRA